ncbi:MAG: M1 family metallopeptidase [Bacteroidota bacterium]
MKNNFKSLGLLLFCFFAYSISVSAQDDVKRAPNTKTSDHGNKFEQLGTMLRTPNPYRGADGAPGPEYWQNRADYNINCTLDTENQQLMGSETITYYNISPNTLNYLWMQLDENQHNAEADNLRFDPSSMRNVMSENALDGLEVYENYDKEYGHQILELTDDRDRPLKYTINKTMLRIELPEPLEEGDEFVFKVDWKYNLVEKDNPKIRNARGGYEYFEDQEEYIFTIVQWFPRMCVYSDVEGWQNKQFTGRGEFTLPFGNYVVKMTVPDDYMVGSTGECLNYDDVLTDTQMERYERAKKVDEPLEIVTLDEMKKVLKKKKSKGKKTWIYKADNVRDFAWTASRKFVWDAMPHMTEDGRLVMCMSYYPEESYPVYSRYSTKVVKHTLDVYSKYTFPYPYPVAISVEASNGMEYPMICFNYGRAEEDGTYTERTKWGAIGVIIHEVGHNYFPMIVNSDERQWTWMDEGINSYLDYIAQEEFDPTFPLTRANNPDNITGYMGLPKEQLEPIMTNSENIKRFGPNAYTKPATGLNMLRETIMGRELFDYAFKEYSKRWMFKHPTPDDFFRTMEDASGVDLDWFWKGWFYSIDAVDISIDTVKYFQADLDSDPEKRTYPQTIRYEEPGYDLTRDRNIKSGMKFPAVEDENLQDFYYSYKPWETEDSVQTYEIGLYEETLTRKEKEDKYGDKHFYELTFTNEGGLVMPLILEWTYEDGTTEIETLPVEIWRKNESSFTKAFSKDKKVESVQLDPYGQLADIDKTDNAPDVPAESSKFKIFKQHKFPDVENPMQKAAKRARP